MAEERKPRPSRGCWLTQGNNMKRALRLLLVVIVAFVILRFAARKYLSSGRVASQVASRLEALYGGPDRVTEVDIGLFRSSLTGVQLFEQGQSASGEPWATIDTVGADVSVLSLLHDRISPEAIKLVGAAVTLRFDKEGRLLTRLPDWSVGDPGNQVTVPNLYIEGGRIGFQKEGVGDLTIAGITATLESKGDLAALVGVAVNTAPSGWGPWTFQGTVDRTTKKASITLKSNRTIHVTQTMLNEFPSVPTAVWRAVQVEG